MRKILLLPLLLLSITLSAQDWEKVTDYMGLDSYSSHFPLIGTNDGLVERISQGYNDWRHLGMKGHKITAILPISNGKADTIMVGTEEGVYYTPDYGITWQKSNIPGVKCNKIVTINSYQARFLALTTSGAYSSRNGVEWTLFALAGKDVRSYEQGGHYNSIFGFICADDYYFTRDYGENYEAAELSIGKSDELIDLQIYSTNVGEYVLWVSLATKKGIYTIRMDSLYFSENPQWELRYQLEADIELCWYRTTGKNYTLATNAGVYFSQDSARTFTNEYQVKGKITNGEYQGQTYNSAAFTLYTTEDYGLTQNGQTIGFSNIQTLELATDGSMFIGTNGFGIYQTKDMGKTWEERNTGLLNLNIRDLDFVGDGRMYAATKEGVYVSQDLGKTWKAVTPTTASLYSLMPAHPKDWNEIFASGKNSFYLLETNNNWNGGASHLNDDIYTIKYIPKMNRYLAGGKYGLWKSETNYVAWTKISFPSYSIYDIEYESNDRILALTKAYIYYSDNDGADWHQLANIPKRDLRDILIDSKNNYYVATDGGVYYSIDRGQEWVEMNDGLLNLPYQVKIDCIELDNEGHLWAGSSVSGLYRSKSAIAEAAIIHSVSNNTITIEYNNTTQRLDITSPERIDKGALRIYACSGRCLFSTEGEINSLSVLLNKGIYIAKMEVGDEIYSQKFIVK